MDTKIAVISFASVNKDDAIFASKISVSFSNIIQY